MTGQKKEEVNRFLAEWMGECWHIPSTPTGKLVFIVPCTKCGQSISIYSENPNFFTDSGFFLLFRKAKESKEWEGFRQKHGWFVSAEPLNNLGEIDMVEVNLIDPSTFALAWAEFLGLDSFNDSVFDGNVYRIY